MATIAVPDGLRAVFRNYQKKMYGLLFKVSAEAIITLAKDKSTLEHISDVWAFCRPGIVTLYSIPIFIFSFQVTVLFKMVISGNGLITLKTAQLPSPVYSSPILAFTLTAFEGLKVLFLKTEAGF
jgi:hypothetical protein